MLLIRTYLAPSAIHGIGLFAGERVAAGTAVWRFAAPLDRIYTLAQVAALHPLARAYLARYGYRRRGHIFLCGDDGRFVNHADLPTCIEGADTASIAARDLAIGDELTEDYRSFDDDAHTHIGGGAACSR